MSKNDLRQELRECLARKAALDDRNRLRNNLVSPLPWMLEALEMLLRLELARLTED